MINKSLLKCEAEKIGVLLDETALDRFDLYAEMLVETNKTLNLTAITDPDEIVYKHFVDSLALLSCVNFKDNAKVIDVGTGAGFPGVVLLIARPDLKMTCSTEQINGLFSLQTFLMTSVLKPILSICEPNLQGKIKLFVSNMILLLQERLQVLIYLVNTVYRL